MKIRGLVSLITGGCSGMGLSTAKHLVAQGGKVILIDTNEQAGMKYQEELGSQNSRFIPCDVTDEEKMKMAYEEGNKVFGGIRTYVNCAGIIHYENILNEEGIHSSENFKRVINVNVLGSFFSTKFAAWHMKNLELIGNERGVIINTSSIFAEHAPTGFAAYGASKGAIEGLLLPMARELGIYKIRLVNIAPGITLTPMVEPFGKETIDGTKPLAIRGELGKPENYAQLVEAIIVNDYLNGTSIQLHDGMIYPNV